MPRMPKKVAHQAIRLARRGCVNRPFFHIVVMPNRAHCQTVPSEQLGSYDPMPNLYQEKLIAFNFERLRYWLAKGAHCTKPVEKLLGLAGFFPVHPMSFIEAERNRKASAEREAAQKESKAEPAREPSTAS